MKRTLYKLRLFVVAVMMLLVCSVVYAEQVVWSDGNIIPYGTEYSAGYTIKEYFWQTYLGVEESGESAYMSIGFKVMYNGGTAMITAGEMDAAAEKWAKKMNYGDVITKSSVEDGFFSTNTGEHRNSSFNINKNDSVLFGFWVGSYGDYEGNGYGEPVYGWVIFDFKYYEPSVREGAAVFGADGIYAGTTTVIPKPKPTPEPCTATLLALGVCACALRRKDAA